MANLPYISEELLKNYQGHLGTTASPATTKRKLASLKKFFSWAEAEGHIDANPILSPVVSKPTVDVSFIASNESKANKTPSKYLNITNLIRLSLGVGMIIVTFLILKALKLPIPFIYTPAAENRNLITITGGSPSPAATPNPSILPSTIASPTPSPSALPTISPTPIPSPTPTPALPGNISNGLITLEGSTPGIKGIGGLMIESENITLSASEGSGGDIVINPDGSGNLNLIMEGSAGNQVSATNANLKTGSLYYGYVGNNNTSHNLLLLQSGSTANTKFSVDASGNTFIAGNITSVKDINLTGNLKFNGNTFLTSQGRLTNISGYSQSSGIFDIDQGAPDYANIDKNLTNSTGAATNDNLIIILDESQVSASSSRDSLVVSRKSGQSDAYAIYVPEGNVKFEDDLGISGNLTSSRGNFINGLVVDNGNASIISGNLGVGIFSPEAKLHVYTDSESSYISEFYNDGNSSNRLGLLIQAGLDDQTQAGPSTLIQFNDGDGNSVGSITFGSSETDYNTTSDVRLKENIKDTSLGLNEIMSIKVRDYNFIKDSESKTSHGFIAQELIEVYPQAVTKPTNSDDYWMVDYSKITPLLVKGVQDVNKKVDTLSSFLGENIAVGAVVTKDFTTNTLVAESGEFINFVSENIKTGSITAQDVIVEGTFKVADIFANSIIANVIKTTEFVAENIEAGRVVASEVVVEGTLTASIFIAENIQAGALTTKEFTTDSATAFTASIDNLIVKTGLVSPKIKTATIESLEESEPVTIASDTKIEGETQTESLAVSSDATVSGTLYADRIVASRLPEDPRIAEIEDLLRDVESNQKFLYEITEKTNLTQESIDGGALSSLSLGKLYVTEQAAVNSLSVAESISLADLVIQSATSESNTSSINTLTAPLSLQSLALAPIEIMAGKIKINTSGDVEFSGNVNIAGNLNTQGESSTKQLSTQKVIIAADTNQIQNPEQTIEGVIDTNATAGQAKIVVGKTEVTIRNPQITDNTLVYVTPVSSTNNRVLFVKSKQVGNFVVGFLDPTEIEISFNWWVIDTR